MARVLSFCVLYAALKASIIVWSFNLDFFSLSLPFPCFFEAKCVVRILFFVDTISRHARQNDFPSLIDSSSPGYYWIRSCMLMFFASQFPLVLFFPLIDGRVRSRAISALLGWLPLLLVDDAILERVWLIMGSRRQPLTYQTYSPASSAPLTKMSAKCGFGQHIWSQIVLFNAKLYK